MIGNNLMYSLRILKPKIKFKYRFSKRCQQIEFWAWVGVFSLDFFSMPKNKPELATHFLQNGTHFLEAKNLIKKIVSFLTFATEKSQQNSKRELDLVALLRADPIPPPLMESLIFSYRTDVILPRSIKNESLQPDLASLSFSDLHSVRQKLLHSWNSGCTRSTHCTAGFSKPLWKNWTN